MAEQQGITLRGRKSFRDHHLYGADDVMNLTHLATQAGAEGFLTTEKDVVKFSERHHCRFPIYVPLLDYARNASLESFIINNLNEISSSL
jgi:tetraacyldisaccharide 4'-kinase